VRLSSLPKHFVCAKSHWLQAAARCCDESTAEVSTFEAAENDQLVPVCEPDDQLPPVCEPAVPPVYEPAIGPNSVLSASTQATVSSTEPAKDAKRISALDALMALLDNPGTDTASSNSIE
jgi:hypothetical protein